jgi:hypothetical protein
MLYGIASIRQWSLFVDNTTTPNFGSGGPTALAATIGGSNMQLNTWTQIVGTRIGGTIEIGYLNGKQSGTYLSATPSVTATDVYFGPNPTGGGLLLMDVILKFVYMLVLLGLLGKLKLIIKIRYVDIVIL